MFCSNCGNKLVDSAKFCSVCGNKLNNTDTAEVVVEMKTKNENGIPVDLLKCREIHISGSKLEFKDEVGRTLTVVYKTEGGILKTPAYDYEACKSNGTSYIYMNSKVKAGDGGFTQTAYSEDGQVIGSASYNGGLKSMAKTEIKIVDMNGQNYILEEEVGLVKGLFKVVAPPDYGIGALASARTGDMKIKAGGITIGMIQSIRGTGFNTYIIRDCQSVQQRIDIRLLILGLTVKTINIK